MTGPFLIPAILIFLLSMPLILGLVPRNRFYGVRTPKTVAKDDYWYPANRYGGWCLIIASGVYLLAALLIPSPAHDSDFGRWLLHLGAFALPLLISLLLIRSYLKRL